MVAFFSQILYNREPLKVGVKMAFFGTVEIIKDRVKIVTSGMIRNKKCKICILPDSVEIIGTSAFSHCANLQKLIFINKDGKVVSNKIVEIREFAFASTNIKKFEYSHYLQSVGSGAFANTPLSVFQYQDDDNIESGLKEIKMAFDHTKMTNLIVPPSLEKFQINSVTVSVLCKDREGNIVKKCNSFISSFFPSSDECSLSFAAFDYNARNLREISLIGDSLSDIQMLINKCSKLERIYLSVDQLNGNSMLEMNEKNIHFVLCDKTEVLDSFLLNPDYNTITITFDSKAKVKKIMKSFFNGLANEEINIPEGVEEIEGFANNLRSLKKIVLPSTLKKISTPIDASDRENLYSIKVSIYANIGEISYKNLCSYLEPSTSTIIINGKYFTEEQKEWFRNLSPANLKLKFIEDDNLLLDEPLVAVKDDKITKDDLKSTYQKSVDSLTQELIELMNLMPDDLKSRIKVRYEQIIQEYYENREKEKNAILSNSSFFGIPSSSVDLTAKLQYLIGEISADQDAVMKLREILEYRKILDEVIESKNDSVESIRKIVQNIKFEMQKMTLDSKSNVSIIEDQTCCGKIREKLEKIFCKAEKEYQIQLKKSFGYKSLSTSVEISPMSKLKEELEHLLIIMEHPKLQTCLEILKSFSQESNDMNICDLSDNIKTMNYVIKNISNTQKKEEWSTLKNYYTDLFLEVISKFIDELIQEETIKELEDKFRCDLSNYISDVMVIEENNNYAIFKIDEVINSYTFLFDDFSNNKGENHTISSLLILEIRKIIPDLDSIKSFLNLEKEIYQKGQEVVEKLRKAENHFDIDNIMQEYYMFLTDIWVRVSTIDSYQKSEIKINKI